MSHLSDRREHARRKEKRELMVRAHDRGKTKRDHLISGIVFAWSQPLHYSNVPEKLRTKRKSQPYTRGLNANVSVDNMLRVFIFQLDRCLGLQGWRIRLYLCRINVRDVVDHPIFTWHINLLIMVRLIFFVPCIIYLRVYRFGSCRFVNNVPCDPPGERVNFVAALLRPSHPRFPPEFRNGMFS